MPQIKQYDAPEGLGLRPTEVGVTAVAAAARRVGAEYNEAAGSKAAFGHMLGSALTAAGDVAVKYIDHQQISQGAAAFASIANAKTKEWEDIAKSADPNDPTIGQRFISENLEPTLDKFKSGFITEAGQRFAETHADQFRQHMFQKTSADMAANAGQAVAINARQTVNSLSNTVRADPTSLDFSLRTLETSIGGVVDSSPNLTGPTAARVRGSVLEKGYEEIVKAAALGHIEKTGTMPDWINDPKYSKYINAGEIKQFEQATRFYDRAAKSEDRAARQLRDYGAKNDFNRQVNELEAQTMPKNVGDRPTLPTDYWDKMRELAKHPGAELEPNLLSKMVTKGETITNRLNKPEPRNQVSHQTTIELLRSMRRTDDQRVEGQAAVDAVYKAYDEGKLNSADFRFLNVEAQNLRTPEGQSLGRERTEFFKRYGSAIDSSMGVTPAGSQKLYAAEMNARQQEEALRRKGLDPHLVYDPRSEYFFGRPENIQKYKGSLDEILQTTRPEVPAPAAAPEGEAGLPRPRSKAERDALPPGTTYIAPDGKRWTRQ